MPITRSYTNAFEIVDYTEDLVSIPNQWNLVNSLGLFDVEGVSQHTITFETSNGTIGMITDQVRGARALMNQDENRALRSLAIPHFNLDDAVKPQDIQGKRAFGSTDAAETEAAVIARKMLRIRRSYSALMETARVHLLTTGGIYAPNGTVVGNMYTEFGITRKEVDFVLGTSTTELTAKIEEGIAHIQDNILSGESITGFVALCSPQFFAKLIAHATVKEAYKYYSSTQEPLRNRLGTGVERQFVHGGITFIEYRGVNPAGSQYIPSGDAYLMPTGTMDTFKTYFSPANKFDYINTIGQEVYMFSYRDPKGSEITIETESNMLNMMRRPQVVVRLFTSN
jgi:hypothetical protein